MASLPMTKADLGSFLARVDEEVQHRKGKLPFFGGDKVRALLQGDRYILQWTPEANSEFREMELCSGVHYEEKVEVPLLGSWMRPVAVRDTICSSESWFTADTEYGPSDNMYYSDPEDSRDRLFPFNGMATHLQRKRKWMR